ncbi:MAG: tetratricopeptide repeat protein [Thermoplasmata archaeon]|nr:MAG: tetratricopeptide repeat protein [Thermoplasmata archaeon]
MVKRSPPLFDPDALSPAELNDIFTDREELLKIMENAVNKFIKNDSRNHLLLVGERGVGKSALLRFFEKKIYKRYNKKQSIIPLLFTDYKCVHDAQDLSDILLRITTELYRLLNLPIEKTPAVYFEEKLEIVEKRFEKLYKKKIVLMMENLQELMEMRPRDKGFEGMRAFLENHSNILLIGTATEIPKSIWKYKSRFWAFFKVHDVKPLNEKDFLDMMERMARFYDGETLLDDNGKLRKEISIKIRSMHHLTSGYPRLGVSLYEVLLLEEPQDIAKSFDSMLDRLSPYFEGIDAGLSSQERYVFGQIVRNLSPNMTKANFSFEDIFENGSENERGRNRALFSKLKKKGFLTVHHKEGRKVFHRLSNPIFGIWYLKTHVKDATFEGKYILEFIHAYYTIEEFVERFGGLTDPDMASVPIRRAFESLKEEYVSAAMTLGMTLVEEGKLDKALGVFEKAIRAAKRKKDREVEASGWRNIGEINLNRGRHREALDAYNKALKINPDDIIAWVNKGSTLGYLKRYQDALKAIDKALKIKPDNALIWYNKGVTLGLLGKLREALDSYNKAIDIDPDLFIAWNNKSLTLIYLGRFKEGLKVCEKALKINPNLAEAWNNKGNALIKLGRHLEALEACEKALEINPNLSEAWNNKGLALTNLGKPLKGLEACEKALDINPKLVEAWNNKGIALKELGRLQKALEVFEMALKINPNFEKAWNNKCNTLFILKKYQKALKACDKALKINSKYANAWNNKGNILFHLGRHKEAMEAYDKALVLLTEKDDWVIASIVKTNKIQTLIVSNSSFNFREELESLLENLRKPGVSTQLGVQLLLTLFQNFIHLGKTTLIWETLEILECFEKDFSEDEKIYPSFEPVNLVAKYIETKVKSSRKAEELLEKAPPHLREEAKMLLGIAQEKKRMKKK